MLIQLTWGNCSGSTRNLSLVDYKRLGRVYESVIEKRRDWNWMAPENVGVSGLSEI